MTAVFTSPEDVVNDALVRIGYPMRVGNLYEGSRAAKVALDLYGQTRDQLLRDGNWGFAQGDISLTLLKSAPVGGYVSVTWSNIYPPVPWAYEYTYPADCLKIRAIKAPPLFIPQWEPKNTNFSIINDNGYTPARKTIVSNVGPTALAVYARQVVNPATWEPSFTEAMCAAMARRMAPSLANLDAEKLEGGDEQVSIAAAANEQG